jgi:hypothetical protein
LVSVALSDKEAFLPMSNHARAAPYTTGIRPSKIRVLPYYKAMHREDIKLNLARRTHRAADIRDVSY